MADIDYNSAVKGVYKGLALLAVVTLVEVFVSLLGKGHIIAGAEKWSWMIWTAGLIIIVLSIYKAYFIIYEFMHMAYEVPGLRMSVLLPTALLIWGMIAFFQEGGSWGKRRDVIKQKNERTIPTKQPNQQQGMKEYVPDELQFEVKG